MLNEVISACKGANQCPNDPCLFVSLILFVVLLQLRYNGLLETIRIRRDGFSWRPSFEEFAERSFKTSE